MSDIIVQLLAEDERCRNDDKWLTYRVMRKFTNIFIPFEDFEKIPAFETIKRCRAKIQNEMKIYQPTSPEVMRKRQRRQIEIRDLMVTQPEDLNSSMSSDYNTDTTEVIVK